jgi:ornithine cyclodeaminase/alanine dehydrogenase-like protein (mu-crystallin family)
MSGHGMAGVRIISADALRKNVRYEDLIDPVARAFEESSEQKAQNGLVVMFPAERPDLGDVYVKTGVLAGRRVFIVKVSPWFAVNVTLGQAQGGFVAVFDSTNGHTLALLNEEHYLSDIRTAAAGAVAARVLAPSHITTAAVLGSGVQAYWQPIALYGQRPFTRLHLWARNLQKASLLKSRLEQALPQVEIKISDDLERVVRTADVLITATLSREPLVRGEWLRPGQHITAVGADDATKCELDPAALIRARVFVDSIETTIDNGDIHRAIQTGKYTQEQIAGELGNVIAGRLIGRSSEEDITIAKLVGIGAQDLVAAETALEILEKSA